MEQFQSLEEQEGERELEEKYPERASKAETALSVLVL